MRFDTWKNQMIEKGIESATIKDDSPRGCKTVCVGQVKPGDEVLMADRFEILTDEDGENREYCKRVCEELESAEDLMEYINEKALDIVYICNQDKSYKAARIAVTLGGPNVYIDTEKRSVCLYWWGKEASYLIDSDKCDEIDELFEELWNC